MSDQQSSRVEQVLELLVEEIEERLWRRRYAAPAEVSPAEPVTPAQAEVPLPEPEPAVEAVLPEPEPEPEVQRAEPEPEAEEELLEMEAEMEPPPMPAGPSHAARLMGRLALGLFIAIILINVPLNRHGTTLATAMPDSASLVVRDGLVVKEEDDEEIYVYQDGKFRWISSLDAFDHFRYTWGDVHIVNDGFLDEFEIGSPLHVLLKCRTSSHIYRLEGGKKRWIRDIETFTAEGHVWEDVRFVSCEYLRNLPDGETIPPDSGPPPQP